MFYYIEINVNTFFLLETRLLAENTESLEKVSCSCLGSIILNNVLVFTVMCIYHFMFLALVIKDFFEEIIMSIYWDKVNFLMFIFCFYGVGVNFHYKKLSLYSKLRVFLYNRRILRMDDDTRWFLFEIVLDVIVDCLEL